MNHFFRAEAETGTTLPIHPEAVKNSSSGLVANASVACLAPKDALCSPKQHVAVKTTLPLFCFVGVCHGCPAP